MIQHLAAMREIVFEETKLRKSRHGTSFFCHFITFFIEKIISTGALLQTQGQEYDGIRNHKLQRNECQHSMDHWMKDYNPSFH